MKQFFLGLATVSLSCLLAACTTPAIISPTISPIPPTATLVSPNVTASAVPQTPTSTPIPATDTPASKPFSYGPIDLHMFDEKNGWVVVTGADEVTSILRTSDGGLTWTDVTPSNQPYRFLTTYFLNAQMAWVYDRADLTYGLHFTGDGGQTWRVLTTDIPAPYGQLKFSDPANGWIEVDAVMTGHKVITLYETHDGGISWKQHDFSSLPIPGIPAHVDTTLDSCNGCGTVFYYDARRMIHIQGDLMSDRGGGAVNLTLSFDQARTWILQTLPVPQGKYAQGMVEPFYPVFFNNTDGLLLITLGNFDPDPNVRYAVLTVYFTHNGGLTWTLVSTQDEITDTSVQPDFISLQDGFVGCGNELCVTHDGALTWHKLKSNLNFEYAEGTEHVNTFEFVDPSTGWAITLGGSSSDIWKTVDGGASWTKLSPMLIP